jgi:Fe(3+) dicitrate transport protein
MPSLRSAHFTAVSLVLSLSVTATAQQDTASRLEPIVVRAVAPLHVLGHMPDVRDGVIYAGKRSEVLLIDSVRANTAGDVERQILGRIPGATFSETQGAGFPSSGVGFRGLDPTQSMEMNTRMNGVNIAGDVYGYPETYFTPPSEALERINVVRGSGALAYGSQIGGAIDYVTRRGAFDSAPTVTVQQTGGSGGLFNSFNAVSGGSSRVSYYGYFHYRGEQGERPNSDYRQTAAFASATLAATSRLTLSGEFTRARNRIHMPGGLSDTQFESDPFASYRARNWLASPWNVAALSATYAIAPGTSLLTTLSYVDADRHLVWRNEDGGPQTMDDPATAREVEAETFANWTLESRLRADHQVFNRPATLSTGVRAGYNRLHRLEGGPGSTGSDFDMNLYGGSWERDVRFATRSAAIFAEELLRVSMRMALTAGARLEHIDASASGYTDVTSSFGPRHDDIPLFAVGAEFLTSPATQLYANVSQSFRPVLYGALTPLGSITRVDGTLRSSSGRTLEAGWRGKVVDALKFDVGAFYLWYGDRAGVRMDSAGEHTISGNVGNSLHRGLEAYAEVDPAERLDLFMSMAYIDARYVSGEYAGNRVELAPRVLARGGITYGWRGASSTLQVSHSGDSFGDASNARIPSDDAVAGYIPAYTLLDWSGVVNIDDRHALTFGANNLANTRYFTKRTGEYPGPGILPGLPRSVYAGVKLTF